jgi:hypothetical protein
MIIVWVLIVIGLVVLVQISISKIFKDDEIERILKDKNRADFFMKAMVWRQEEPHEEKYYKRYYRED